VSEAEAAEEEAGHRQAEALMRLIHRVSASNSERATMELNLRQRLILQCLGLEGDRSIAAIGQRLGFSPSTMTGLVDRLEEQGYVKRRPHASDRRVTLLVLSRKGKGAFLREIDWYRSLVDEIFGSLGEEARQVVLEALETLPAANPETRASAA
jgi:DNA-binding MarR family transcriptional regulator